MANKYLFGNVKNVWQKIRDQHWQTVFFIWNVKPFSDLQMLGIFCHFKFWHNRKNGLQSTWNYLNGQTRFRIMGTGDYSLVNTHYVIMSTSTHNQQKFPTIFFYSITTNPILVPDSHLPHYQLSPLKWLLGRLLRNYVCWHALYTVETRTPVKKYLPIFYNVEVSMLH